MPPIQDNQQRVNGYTGARVADISDAVVIRGAAQSTSYLWLFSSMAYHEFFFTISYSWICIEACEILNTQPKPNDVIHLWVSIKHIRAVQPHDWLNRGNVVNIFVAFCLFRSWFLIFDISYSDPRQCQRRSRKVSLLIKSGPTGTQTEPASTAAHF